jgi:hypothetical protein
MTRAGDETVDEGFGLCAVVDLTGRWDQAQRVACALR